MRRSSLLIAAALMLSRPAAAQVTDSVRIRIQGAPDVVHIAPVPQLTVGDSVQFTAEVLDAQGRPVTAVITWASSDTTALRIDPITGMGVAVRWLDAQEAVYVIVRADRPVSLSLRVFSIRAGASTAGKAVTLTSRGDSAQFCAYFLNAAGAVVAMNEGTSRGRCPELFQVADPGELAPRIRRTVAQLRAFAPDFAFAVADTSVIELDPSTGLGVAR